MSMTIEIC